MQRRPAAPYCFSFTHVRILINARFLRDTRFLIVRLIFTQLVLFLKAAKLCGIFNTLASLTLKSSKASEFFVIVFYYNNVTKTRTA